jgi:GTP cyclohydrolase I
MSDDTDQSNVETLPQTLIYAPQRNKAITHIRDALRLLGMDCTSQNPSIQRTPDRFISYLLEFFNPFDVDELLGEGFEAVSDKSSIHGMVVQSKIPFRSVCEHHLLPMLGYAYVGYIPNKKIIGISKMTRLVEAYGTQQPTLQEAITEKVADALFDKLESKGSIVVIKAQHMCMSARGVGAPEVKTITSCVRGVFRDVSAAREEFFCLAGIR